VTRPDAPSDRQDPIRVTEGPLSPDQAGEVIALTGAAQAADGVAPLSENVLLQIRHGSGAVARDLLLTVDGSAAGYAHLDGPDAGEDGDASGELVIHPAHRRRGYGSALISAVTAGSDGYGTRMWAHGDLPAAAALARSAGFSRFRALWQMRMPLAGRALAAPAWPAGVSVRTFRPGEDEGEWLAVNGRAFAHHPEQGSWTRKDLEVREAEPWFDPDGFFIAERDGRMAGFHWTKVHPAGGDGGGPIGEVYVVGVDPAQQGGGLGRALTLAGVTHLQRLGLSQVMLYVDESNTAATRMYTALGFGRWHTDVMYRRSGSQLTGP
jgi:mycothiol synthase